MGRHKTNLYHNHAKSKNVCFRCYFIAILENLWRSPRSSISLYLRYKNGVQPANYCGKSEIRQTCTAVVVNENIRLSKGCWCSLKELRESTYPFQVSVYHMVCMKVVETFHYIQ